MTEIEEFISAVSRDLDKTLDEHVPKSKAEPTRLHEAIRWSIFAGGKRIRPAILTAAGRTFGAVNAQLSQTAAAVEMIHTYSLIHDDLPAMDNDDLRRGKATCHKQFGEATAILAGDVLQTLAFKAIADDETLGAETRIRLISTLADASGTPTGMVSGQQLDLDAEGKTLPLEKIEQIHRQKTGALISAAAVAGAIIGDASEDELTAIKIYGARLGLLFQVTDDLLDVTQRTGILGKTAGKDESSEKATYPGHFGIEKTRAMAAAIRDEACDALLLVERDTSLLRDLTDLVVTRKR
ncbi:MAG: farnesyl diphosphate synthase [Pyrinomonadaceae bacterium]